MTAASLKQEIGHFLAPSERARGKRQEARVRQPSTLSTDSLQDFPATRILFVFPPNMIETSFPAGLSISGRPGHCRKPLAPAPTSLCGVGPCRREISPTSSASNPNKQSLHCGTADTYLPPFYREMRDWEAMDKAHSSDPEKLTSHLTCDRRVQ